MNKNYKDFQDVIAAIAKRGLEVPFVVMTGQGDEQLAVEVMKLGAADYLVKDTALIERLPAVIERAFNTIETKMQLREAEKVIWEREAQLRAITDSAQDGMIMMDPDGTISFWNPAAERTGRRKDGREIPI